MSRPHAPEMDTCDECGARDETHREMHRRLVTGDVWCEMCIDHGASVCADCGDACPADSEPDDWTQRDDEWRCQECHEDYMREIAP